MIVISGGGTGGHLRIVASLKEEFNKREIKPIFIGGLRGQDREWFENDSGFLEKRFLNISGVVNKGFLGKIKTLLNIFFLAIKLGFWFKKIGVLKVVSVGGYAAAPSVFAAILFRIDLYIHEQNATMGSLNRLSKPFAKEFFSSFIDSSKCKEYPIEDRFFKSARIRKELNSIIFLGGSLGAKSINELALKLAIKLDKMNIKIIHQTGSIMFSEIKKFYKDNKINADCFKFTTDIDKKINKADFAISRAGASTMFELVANAIPTLFIPYPYASADHQYANAQFLVSKKLAYCIREKNINIDEIIDIIKNNHYDISNQLYNLAHKNGTSCIVDLITQ